MDFPTTLSFVVVVFLIACGAWLASLRRPEWRRWSRVSAWVVAATAFLSAWYGGIGA
jgi:hypothetical protein